MSITSVKFNSNDRPEFIKELRHKVNQYFKDHQVSRYANLSMKLKTVFMISLYFIPLIFLLSGAIQSLGLMFLMWGLMSLGMSGIGLSIMHDANHGSYSKNKSVNAILGYLVNFLGAYHVNWKIQHNVLHHSFTNIDGFDEDIEKRGIMRFSPEQPHMKRYYLQAFYAPFLYGLMTIYWLTSKDFKQLVGYNQRNLLSGQGRTLKSTLAELSFNKVWYIILTVILPIIILPFAWWQILLGFFMMHFICGFILACIFQPAHVLEHTNFYKPDQTGSVENNWAIHQMLTTSNFANGSRLFSWLIGGLNYQIEHHLFPNICHVHYRKISKIVKETATEYGVPYYQHKTFMGALGSHFSLLHQLGTGAYDKKMQNA